MRSMLADKNGDLIDLFESAENARASLPGVHWQPDESKKLAWKGWLDETQGGQPDYMITLVQGGRGGFRRSGPPTVTISH